MYDAAFGTFLQAVREKNANLLRSSFSDALKTYEATRWIADASQPTPQSAWNAPAPWVTRTQPFRINAAAEVIQEARQQQPEQVRYRATAMYETIVQQHDCDLAHQRLEHYSEFCLPFAIYNGTAVFQASCYYSAHAYGAGTSSLLLHHLQHI